MLLNQQPVEKDVTMSMIRTLKPDGVNVLFVAFFISLIVDSFNIVGRTWLVGLVRSVLFQPQVLFIMRVLHRYPSSFLRENDAVHL